MRWGGGEDAEKWELWEKLVMNDCGGIIGEFGG
jgi:hypothetical protein